MAYILFRLSLSPLHTIAVSDVQPVADIHNCADPEGDIMQNCTISACSTGGGHASALAFCHDNI